MRLVRPVRGASPDAFARMAETLGPGMTTLPAEAEALEHRVVHSERTFSGIETDEPRCILALEHMVSEAIVGVAVLYPCFG